MHNVVLRERNILPRHRSWQTIPAYVSLTNVTIFVLALEWAIWLLVRYCSLWNNSGPFKLFNSGKTILMWDVLKSKMCVCILTCECCVYRGCGGNCLSSFRCLLELGPVLPLCCFDFRVCSSLKMLALWWGRGKLHDGSPRTLKHTNLSPSG